MIMWYVELIENWEDGKTQIWEGLTREQSRQIHMDLSKYSAMVRSGFMADNNPSEPLIETEYDGMEIVG